MTRAPVDIRTDKSTAACVGRFYNNLRINLVINSARARLITITVRFSLHRFSRDSGTLVSHRQSDGKNEIRSTTFLRSTRFTLSLRNHGKSSHNFNCVLLMHVRLASKETIKRERESRDPIEKCFNSRRIRTVLFQSGDRAMQGVWIRWEERSAVIAGNGRPLHTVLYWIDEVILAITFVVMMTRPQRRRQESHVYYFAR